MATRAQQIPELTGPFFDGDGTQLSSPYAKFYIGGGAGSANTKDAYSDYLKQTSFTKVALSSEGNSVYGDGVYDIEMYEGDPDNGGTLAWTITYRKYVATIGNVRTITSDTIGTIDDSLVLADTSSGDVTYTLPDAALSPGRQIDIQKISASNSMTIAAPSGQTIDNAASIARTANNVAVSAKSNGSNWFGVSAISTTDYETKERTAPEATTITPGSDADVTLSSAQEAFARLILVDGSWTSAHNIIVSTTERGYYVDNSSGSYTATLKTSAGTGIAIASGESMLVLCDGTNVIDPLSKGKTNFVEITSSQAYTPPSGLKQVKFIAVGGGGGGGGVDGQGVGTAVSGAGGGGGSWGIKTVNNPSGSYTITIGAGGAGGASGASNGTDGGDTTIVGSGINLTAPGGGGGTGKIGIAGTAVGFDGGTTTIATGGDVNGKGIPSSNTGVVGGDVSAASMSGFCPYIGGGIPIVGGGAGDDADAYGEGGGSSLQNDSASNWPGGDGFQGVVFIEEKF